MTVTPQNMRDTMRLWPSGVTIVTTVHGDRRAGMTLSAFNSLSVDPPMIVICPSKETTLAQTLVESRVFAVSILAAGQSQLSDRFAGRVALGEGEDRFDGVSMFTAATGSPIVQDALAWLDCRVQTLYDGGSHWIVVGEVLATNQNTDGLSAPLVYFNRAYRDLNLQPTQP